METQGKHNFSRKWVTTSVCLLVVYLSFFHVCIGQSRTVCIVAGVVCWCIWALICWTRRHVFLNRFEYLIHQAVGLDILIEGFSPLHEGYGFYVCAIAFWALLLAYHWSLSWQKDKVNESIAQTPDSAVGG